MFRDIPQDVKLKLQPLAKNLSLFPLMPVVGLPKIAKNTTNVILGQDSLELNLGWFNKKTAACTCPKSDKYYRFTQLEGMKSFLFIFFTIVI